MKLISAKILNFKSLKDVSLQFGNLHALVGSNNAGKSNLLKALEFLFNPSSKLISDDTFWSMDTDNEIRIEAIFSDLSDVEKDKLRAYLMPDGTFHISRYAKLSSTAQSDDIDNGDSKINIGQQYKKSMPKVEWLQESKINTSSINDWWSIKDSLVVNGISFYEFLQSSTKPGVGVWKEKAELFISQHQENIEVESNWIDNPKGYAGVLKGTLPCFVLVPAVKDVTDESKGTKSSPFGKLLSYIISNVSEDKQAKIKEALKEVTEHLNRSGADKRVSMIAQTEKELNTLLNDIFPDCDLEIEFETPSLEILLSSPKVYIDDGLRNSVENKGHGLQRAVIFSILRQYANLSSLQSDGNKRTLIIAIEEPELYMHPQAQRTIRKVFTRISQGGGQVLFSTHSSLLVDVACFDEIVRIEMLSTTHKDQRTNISTAWQLPISKLIDDLIHRHPQVTPTEESLRELYSNSYNPHRNEGFFASKIILVEGPTEEYCLPIYADAIDGCSFDPKGISVIECGGKCSIDRLYRIFNELHIPCFIVIDYDFGHSDPSITNKSRELIELVRDTAQYNGSFYISNKIAFFPFNWEEQLSNEIDNYSDLERAACSSMGIKKDGSKPLIGRYIARQLMSQTPPVIPNSINQIIRQAVLVIWHESCLSSV